MPRLAAIAALEAVEARDAYSNVALDQAIRDRRLSGSDAGLASELTYGVLKNRPFLDLVLHERLSRPLSELPVGARQALRIGAYQLLFLDRVPVHAALHATVEAAKQRWRGLTGLVNAVLRRLSEQVPSLLLRRDAGVRDGASLGLRYGLPPEVVATLLSRFDLAAAERYARALQPAPPLTLRARIPSQRDDLVDLLRRAGFDAAPARWAPSAIALTGGPPVEALSVVGQRAVVQDEGSQLVGYMAAPSAGQSVLDVCAGRGGKTFQLADFLGGGEGIVATDIHAGKLEDLEATARHLGISGVRSVPPKRSGKSKATIDWEALPAADIVLVDAPCSGFGLLRRHPELRFKMDAARLRGLAVLQQELLGAAQSKVAPGGHLVYAVCSDRPEEGRDAIAAFLDGHPDWHIALPPPVPDWATLGLTADDRTLRVSPPDHGTDGFFAVRLARRGP